MQLRIEIESGADPIRGTLVSGDPPVSRPFTGWLQLTELIVAARNACEPDHADDDPIP